MEAGSRQIRGACALDCPDTCGWIVTVKGGEPVSLRGDPDHPFTRGSLCNKVDGYLAYARSPDRVLYPLRRVGPKGSGEFTRISWDEALDRIAAGLGDAIAQHGAEAIWPFVGTGSMGLIQGIYGAGRRLWNVLGTSRHVVTICTIAGGFGTGYTLGDNRYPGGGVSYDTRGFYGLDWAALWRDDLRPRTARALHMTRLGEGLLEVDNPPVEALFVYASNPAASVPHQTKVLRGLARNDLFTVVIEHFLTDTARYADIVLPATMQIEHRDLLIAYGHLYVAWNEPAAPPPGECLPATEIFRRLARTMGLDTPALYDSDETMARQVLDSGHPSLAGITLEELKARGWMRLNYPDPFVPFATAFPTPSGKLEFVSERMAQAGLDPVAGYTPAHETSQRDTTLAREYPLALVTPADHYFLNSIFANVPRQQRRSGAATLLIHPDDAAPRAIATGDEVRVANARGSFFAVADVSDRVRPGVVASPKGRWPGDSKQGATINATVDERDSDMGGGAVYHDNRVRVDKSA